MKIFEINGKKIEFDMGEELTIKELRKISPYMKAIESGQEIETIYQVGARLAVNSDEAGPIIDSFSIEEFEKFAEFISSILDVKKKMI